MEVKLSDNFQSGGWENRIVRHKVERSNDCFQYYYSICEVHSVNGVIFMCTDAKPGADNMVWLRNSWMDMLEAFRKPVLDYENDILNNPAAKELRDRIFGRDKPERPIEEIMAERDADELLEKMSLTKEEFLAEIGVEIDEENPFDPVEYYKGQVIDAEKQERDFEKYHGKTLPDIYDLFVVERLKEREDAEKDDQQKG